MPGDDQLLSCRLQPVADASRPSAYVYRCATCGRMLISLVPFDGALSCSGRAVVQESPPRLESTRTPPIVSTPDGNGPGTEFRRIVESLGISATENCGCRQRERRMNALGPAGCRQQFETLASELRQAAAAFSWTDRFKAAVGVAAEGLLLRINWLDPIPGLLEEAIRRAETSCLSSLG